ncbi:energy transducer TonB [Parabacteroides pacaensis]|uniref:energy transducer TonB n=1 Tax=Parabacteroides pacaensis TaxID=2086575 RepID=UPI000D10626B|nr:energy transducer TonB [Parabacteroides pacaensis]
MEIKKSPKADLENRKTLSLLMGYVVALAILFVAFEWSTRDIQVAKDEGVGDIIAEEEIEITRPEDVPPPLPPPPTPIVVDELNVVEDDIEVADAEIMSSDDSQDAAQVQNYTPPAVVEEEEEDSNHVFAVVEEMPEFPGGETALMQYINKGIKYPVIAQENGIQGRVVVSFVINKDGKVVEAQVMRGVDPSLDKEALRVIGTLPAWKPGKQRGKPVRVKYTVPVLFRLQ